MGKFDRLARGEKAEDRAAARGKKRKFLPTADKVGPCWPGWHYLPFIGITCFGPDCRGSRSCPVVSQPVFCSLPNTTRLGYGARLVMRRVAWSGN